MNDALAFWTFDLIYSWDLFSREAIQNLIQIVQVLLYYLFSTERAAF